MRFRLDEAIAADQIAVRVTYLDRGLGAWSLGVSNSPEKEVVHNVDSGRWKTITVSMPQERLRDAELLLNHESGADTIFHMIEIERREN